MCFDCFCAFRRGTVRLSNDMSLENSVAISFGVALLFKGIFVCPRCPPNSVLFTGVCRVYVTVNRGMYWRFCPGRRQHRKPQLNERSIHNGIVTIQHVRSYSPTERTPWNQEVKLNQFMSPQNPCEGSRVLQLHLLPCLVVILGNVLKPW